MAVFYGLYVADERLAAALDLLRFLAEPQFVRRAHITVRGPYNTPQSDILRTIPNKTYQILFDGVDSFIEIGKKQNTVFLKCEVPSIEQVWYKPDFHGEIRPHLTLYDGEDRGQAIALLRCCSRYRLKFRTSSTELIQIQPKSKAAEMNEFSVHQGIYDEILGRRIDYLTIQRLHWRERLPFFERVAHFIDKNYVLKKSPRDEAVKSDRLATIEELANKAKDLQPEDRQLLRDLIAGLKKGDLSDEHQLALVKLLRKAGDKVWEVSRPILSDVVTSAIKSQFGLD